MILHHFARFIKDDEPGMVLNGRTRLQGNRENWFGDLMHFLEE